MLKQVSLHTQIFLALVVVLMLVLVFVVVLSFSSRLIVLVEEVCVWRR
jgi:hypothetical protein